MRVAPWLSIVGSGQFGLSSRFDCHLYALHSDDRTLLIDAGSGIGHARVVANLREAGAEPGRGAILLTHAHPDHVCGAAALAAELDWPVVTSAMSRSAIEAGDAEGVSLVSAKRAGAYPQSLEMTACAVAGGYEDGQRITLCGFDILPIHVRGHSRDSFAFVIEVHGKRCLFAADVLFYGGVLGLINAEGSELSGYRADLGKLSGLAIDALLPAHGLFTLEKGQRHADVAIDAMAKGFVPRSIGQGDLIF